MWKAKVPFPLAIAIIDLLSNEKMTQTGSLLLFFFTFDVYTNLYTPIVDQFFLPSRSWHLSFSR